MLEGFVLGVCAGMLIAYIIVRVVVWSTLRQLERDNIEVDDLIDKMKQKIEDKIIAAIPLIFGLQQFFEGNAI
jgi:hypothetical protein